MILERISKETGVGVDYLLNIALTASHRYKSYSIAKRTRGRRQINHPSPELKFLQRWMARELFTLLPIHEAVLSYRPNIGILANANLHARNNYLLKIDFSDFFPSLTGRDVEEMLTKNSVLFTPSLSDEDIQIIILTVCRNGALTVGAPSSPILSNTILYDFDLFLSAACHNERVLYSRYADDLFLSTNKPNRLTGLFELISKDLSQRQFPKLAINQRKTVFTSRKRRRVVTGLTLTSDGNVSIGRAKKRRIRSMIYRYTKGQLSVEDISFLRGYIAFVNGVEPDFNRRLGEKFGTETINSLMIEEIVPRKRTTL